ncbi:LppU/SCO3897 family protein [Geodermatophilus sp. FMUSA9-8]|uniref:LppU/SCO3897 family protein n=1 Tax=Geodermatophilus sp. FMUSA9-8 TaxID=3120155 RepID=UPI00300A073D
MTNPGQPGQPFPPQGGPQQPGQPFPPQGQPQPGQPYPPQGQPFPPQGQPFPPQGAPGQFGATPFGGGPGQPAPKSGKARKVGGVVAAVAVAGGIAAFRFFGVGDPEVGDCIAQEGASSFETVDCDDESAQARVVGVVEEKVTESEFYETSYQPCGEWPSATQALWSGETGGEGTVYCAEDV